MKDLISVIIPVYKYQPYLNDSIKSILAQTYKNLEIIIVSDDKSSLVKNTISALQDNRLKLIEGPGKGIAAALNEGIKQANGKFLARMDSDDFALANKFEKQIYFLVKNNLDICGTNLKTIGSTNYLIKFPETDKEIKYYILFGSPMSHPSVLGKTTLFKEFPYNESIGAAEDYELWIKMAISKKKFGNLQEPLLLYRIHSAQGSKNSLEQTNKSIALANEYADYFFKHNIDENFIKNGYGFFHTYLFNDVNILLYTILKYAQLSNISMAIFERNIYYLYSKIQDYSFKVLIGYYKFTKINRIRINFKFILYLLFKSFYKKNLPPNVITYLKSKFN